MIPRRYEDEYPEAAAILMRLSQNKNKKIVEWDIKQNGDVWIFKTIENKKYLVAVEKLIDNLKEIN